jgi:hypothetical protein
VTETLVTGLIKYNTDEGLVTETLVTGLIKYNTILKNQIQFTRNKSANTSHQRHLLDKGDTVSICFNIDVHPCIKGEAETSNTMS